MGRPIAFAPESDHQRSNPTVRKTQNTTEQDVHRNFGGPATLSSNPRGLKTQNHYTQSLKQRIRFSAMIPLLLLYRHSTPYPQRLLKP